MSKAVALTPTADALAVVAAVEINGQARRLVVDTMHAACVVFCPVLSSPTAPNATECLAMNGYSSCPTGTSMEFIGITPICYAKAPTNITLTLGTLSLSAVPASVASTNVSDLLHASDGILGLARRDFTVGEPTSSLITGRGDALLTFTLRLQGDSPTLTINGFDKTLSVANGWARVSVQYEDSDQSKLSLKGFSENLDPSFVQARATVPASMVSGSATAWLDASGPSIVFPKEEFAPFFTKYLTSCTPRNATSKYDTPHFYYCDKDVALPRLAFTTADATFFLDRDDYVIVDPDDATQVRVLVQNESYVYSWALGLPFLRKFPSYFDYSERAVNISLYCEPDVSCDLTPWTVNYTSYTRSPTADDGATTAGGVVIKKTKVTTKTTTTVISTRVWIIIFAVPLVVLGAIWQGLRLWRKHLRSRRSAERLADPATEASINTDPPAFEYVTLRGPSTARAPANVVPAAQVQRG